MSYVRVTNGTPQDIEGRYDGKDYLFGSGTSEDVPIAVAAHVFGFGGNKDAALARLGWLVTSNQRGEALEKLAQVRFEAIEMVGRTIADEDDAPTSQMVPDRISAASPRVSADGNSGGDVLSPPGEPITLEPDTI